MDRKNGRLIVSRPEALTLHLGIALASQDCSDPDEFLRFREFAAALRENTDQPSRGVVTHMQEFTDRTRTVLRTTNVLPEVLCDGDNISIAHNASTRKIIDLGLEAVTMASLEYPYIISRPHLKRAGGMFVYLSSLEKD